MVGVEISAKEKKGIKELLESVLLVAEMEELKAKKTDKSITEDEQKLWDKKIQELTDKYCAEADHLAAVKEKEILSI